MNALSIDWAAYLAAIPAILGILALNGGLWFLSLLLIGASSVVYILLNKRKVIVRSSGKPPAEPRSLFASTPGKQSSREVVKTGK